MAQRLLQSQYIYGFHSVAALLRNKNAAINEVFLLEGRRDKRSHEIIMLAKKRNVQCKFLPRKALDKLTDFAKHQGFVALCKSKQKWRGEVENESAKIRSKEEINSDKRRSFGKEKEEDLPSLVKKVGKDAFFLVLDGIQDPHNLGACLRAANAAGVSAVIAPKDNAVGLTETVRKVASGAAEDTPFFQVTNLVRTLQWLKESGIWVYGTDVGDNDNSLTAKSIYETKLQPPLAIVMGSEEKGLRRLTRRECDFLINIPMFGNVQSLNVAVAAGICLFEVVRNHSALRAPLRGKQYNAI